MLIPFAYSLDPDQFRSNPFSTLIVFLKEFFEKVNFEKQKHEKLPSIQVLISKPCCTKVLPVLYCSLFQIKLFCFHPSQRQKLDHRLIIHKDKTLSEATEMAYKVNMGESFQDYP